MSTELIQAVVDTIFKGNMLFLAPILFVLGGLLFADRLIELLFNAIGERRSYR
jgi:hypothetical protein